MPNPVVLDGVQLAEILQYRFRRQIETSELKPHLAVILCSSDPASRVYVKKKIEACANVGIVSTLRELGDCEKPTTLLDIQETIRDFNVDSNIHGILLQLPLPTELHASRHCLYDLIDPAKDVDVLNPENTGLLLQGRPRFLPCTPQAIRLLLSHYGFSTKGRNVVVINRSDIVGKPLAAMLVQDDPLGNATVCLCHDNTPPEKLKEVCLWADIIVVAVGIKWFLTVDMIQPGVIVVDVGINREGKKLYGDVHPDVYPFTTAYSPVPGGVGPMTVTMLMKNTLEACEFYNAPNCP